MATKPEPKIDFSQFTDEERKWIAECEVEIINHEAFIAYKRLQRTTTKLAQLKSGNYTYTIKNNSPSNFYGDVIDLPQEIQDKFEARFKVYAKQYTLMMNANKKAFGTSANAATKLTHKAKQQGLIQTRKMDLIEMFSRMFPIKEVLQHVREEWAGGRDLTLADLKEFYNDNLELINRGVEAHKTDWSGMRLVAKKSRIEELTWTANIMRGKIAKTQNREDIKMLSQLLDQVRKECEGERLQIEGNMNLNIQGDVNVHIRNNIIGNIPLREIIIGRVAARNGVTPLHVLGDLNSSYYAKINTLINGGEFVDFEEIGNFPSQQPYDFDFIKRANIAADQQRAVELHAMDNTKLARQMVGDPIKDKLLSILSQNQSLVRSKQTEE